MTTSAPVLLTDGGDVDTGVAGEYDRPEMALEQDAARAESPWSVAARCFRAWKDGDRAALDELVRRVSPLLWQVVRAYGVDRASAEDVVQTTWMTLMRKSEQVRDDQAVLRWLTMTARREAWRVAQSQTRSNPTDDAVIEVSLPAARSPETEVVEYDATRRLWRHVQELDARCQHLLRVIAFQARPDYATLAAHLDMPMGSIGPTRSRCLSKLRSLIASDEGVRR